MLYSCYYIWSDKVLWFNPSLTLHSSVFQEEAKDFITLDNLDQQIEEALDNPKNYNFAIDKEGRVVKRTAFSAKDFKNQNTYNVHNMYSVTVIV